jgi:hypothetical protein
MSEDSKGKADEDDHEQQKDANERKTKVAV